jgi:hypothetical protein
MTTAAWSTVLDQTSDAGFRNYGSELNGKFSGVGMVQTTDTGQINWTTATRPAVINTAAGYEIWKLSSGNLYFKVEYGTGGTQPTIPSLWITVGTGSNGSGTLTGQLSTRTQCGLTTSAIISTSTNYQSYLCATANYFGLSWKIASTGTAGRPRSFISVMQTVDSTGAATSVGYGVMTTTISGAPQLQCIAAAAGVTGGVIAGNFTLIPNNSANPPPNSLDGSGNNQAFLVWYSILGTTPMIPLLHLCVILVTDLAVGVSASMTNIGTTAHTYISAASNTVGDAIIAASNLAFAMVYE